MCFSPVEVLTLVLTVQHDCCMYCTQHCESCWLFLVVSVTCVVHPWGAYATVTTFNTLGCAKQARLPIRVNGDVCPAHASSTYKATATILVGHADHQTVAATDRVSYLSLHADKPDGASMTQRFIHCRLQLSVSFSATLSDVTSSCKFQRLRFTSSRYYRL